MNLLAIDTSTNCASLALSIKGELLRKDLGSMRNHASLILPMIEQLMAEAFLSFSQLDGIVFGKGPGSFTGLRISCSVAKGLAYAQDLPLYPVSSLAAIANEVFFQFKHLINLKVLALIDARMNQLYWALFNSKGREGEEQVSLASDIEKSLKDTPLILAGVGYEEYESQFAPNFRKKIKEYLSIYPKAEAMIRLVLTAKIKAVEPIDALPSYIRNQITQGKSHG